MRTLRVQTPMCVSVYLWTHLEWMHGITAEHLCKTRVEERVFWEKGFLRFL